MPESILVDHASHAITTVEGKVITGVLQKQSTEALQLINEKEKSYPPSVTIALGDIEAQNSPARLVNHVADASRFA